jgi:hypothetical protein
MKTHIKKIFLIAAALVFLCAGVSFAKDRNPRHNNNNSRWHARGQIHKAPAYRPYRYKSRYYVDRHPGHGYRHHGYYYPKKNYKRHNYHRHYQWYPSRNTFFFGFVVR